MFFPSVIGNYFKNSQTQILKFLVIGLSSTLLDLFLLFLLKEKIHLSAVTALYFNQIVVILYNFLLNKYWSFQSKQMVWQQFVRYLILVLFNYLMSVFLMYLFHEILDFNYLLVRIFSICLMFSLNFFMYKHWVYR